MEIQVLMKNLCKVLQLLDVCNLKPEFFRKAKHNQTIQNNSNEVLLNLLHKAVCFIEKLNTSSREVDYQEHMVEPRLKNLGYSGKFSESDSREILIAFGWLIASYTLIDSLVFKMISTVPLFCNEALILLKKKPLLNEIMVAHDLNNDMIEEECIDNIMYLSQKLNSSLKLWQLNEEQKILLLCKIQKFVEKDKDIRKLIILRNPELQLKLNFECEKFHVYMEAYFNWKNNENLFWKWMESVLQLKWLENKIRIKVPVCPEIPEFVQGNLDELKNNFQNYKQKKCKENSENLIEGRKCVYSLQTTSSENGEKFSILLMGNKFKHSFSNMHFVHTFSSNSETEISKLEFKN